MTEGPEEREIRSRVETALKQLSVSDSYLLRHDVSERTITHRLATHLEKHFDGWDVDVEYTLLGAVTKQAFPDLERELDAVGVDEPLARDTLGRTLYPDVIVHRRATPETLLALEFRKGSSPVPADWHRRKLRSYRDDPELRFRHACLVQLETDANGKPYFRVEFL